MNSVPDINWYDTDDIVRDIKRLQAKYPAPNTFVADLALERRLAKTNVKLPNNILDAFNKLARNLYDTEGFAAPPASVPRDLYRTVEGARRRDKLLNLRRKLADPEQKLRQFKDTILQCIAIFVDALPSISP